MSVALSSQHHPSVDHSRGSRAEHRSQISHRSSDEGEASRASESNRARNELIQILKPEKRNKMLFTKILDPCTQQPLSYPLQSPTEIVETPRESGRGKLEIFAKDELLTFLKAVDRFTVKKLHEKSKEWFGRTIPQEKLRNNYKTALIPGWNDRKPSIKLYFDREEAPKKLEKGDSIEGTIILNGCWIGKKMIGCEWRFQFKDDESPRVEDATESTVGETKQINLGKGATIQISEHLEDKDRVSTTDFDGNDAAGKAEFIRNLKEATQLTGQVIEPENEAGKPSNEVNERQQTNISANQFDRDHVDQDQRRSKRSDIADPDKSFEPSQLSGSHLSFSEMSRKSHMDLDEETRQSLLNMGGAVNKNNNDDDSDDSDDGISIDEEEIEALIRSYHDSYFPDKSEQMKDGITTMTVEKVNPSFSEKSASYNSKQNLKYNPKTDKPYVPKKNLKTKSRVNPSYKSQNSYNTSYNDTDDTFSEETLSDSSY
jgi:hypothetical protein